MELANWNWKVAGQFVWERYGISISRSGCLKWLHRLGFAYKRPKKRLLKADEGKRTDFAAEYATLWEERQETGARIFFADEAHFRADAGVAGQMDTEGGASVGGVHQPQVRREGQPATRRYVWRRARACPRESGGWRGWNWRATATLRPRWPS